MLFSLRPAPRISLRGACLCSSVVVPSPPYISVQYDYAIAAPSPSQQTVPCSARLRRVRSAKRKRAKLQRYTDTNPPCLSLRLASQARPPHAARLCRLESLQKETGDSGFSVKSFPGLLSDRLGAVRDARIREWSAFPVGKETDDPQRRDAIYGLSICLAVTIVLT